MTDVNDSDARVDIRAALWNRLYSIAFACVSGTIVVLIPVRHPRGRHDRPLGAVHLRRRQVGLSRIAIASEIDRRRRS
jgi:hypothetical protein